jgi:molybdopterin converting factor small subunit
MPTLATIEALARELAERQQVLNDRAQAMQIEIESVRRRHMRGLKAAVLSAQEITSRLHAAIEAAPELFVKPRTQVFAGIKVGLQKQRGSLSWADTAKLVELIRRHLPEQFDQLVRTEYRPIRDALNRLDVATLRKLGVTVSDDTDAVLIKPTDGGLDKLIEALIREAMQDEEVEA